MSNNFSNTTALVTGGAGSIGKFLVKKLLSNDFHAVRELDNN